MKLVKSIICIFVCLLILSGYSAAAICGVYMDIPEPIRVKENMLYPTLCENLNVEDTEITPPEYEEDSNTYNLSKNITEPTLAEALAKKIENQPKLDLSLVTESNIIYLAKMAYGEARGCSESDIKNCMRTVLNRVDDPRWPNTVKGVVTQANQYTGYHSSNPVWDSLYTYAEEVLIDWCKHNQGYDVYWNNYESFYGDGTRNHFR